LKSLSLGVSALALTASLAAAADLPARNIPARQAPVALLPLFTGFYAGLGAGGGWNRDHFVETSSCLPTCAVSATGTGSGFVGGVYGGYAFRFNDVVLGIEGEFGPSSVSHKTTVPLSEPDTVKSQLLVDGSLRLRAGYAFGAVMPYITGGLAFGQIRHTYDVYTSAAPFTLTGSYETTRWRTGWTLGAGMEWAFAPFWTARVEYRYTDFGRYNDTLGPPVFATTFTQRHRESFNAIRIGVTRYF
jgi:outer membrane immunogenic protein